MELVSGSRLGPYEIAQRVGAGGMGEVYKAFDTRLGRVVAIKVLSPARDRDDALKRRFAREARAISALNHQHICSLHDIGSENGHDFLVMEYLEGESLAERLSRGPMPVDEALQIGIQVVSALERAHRHGIIHRDLKPANIMLGKGGAKLLDFGLARMTDIGASGASALTSDDALIGTVEYMAPEQLSGREADERADIFAFGVVLYEMLTGTRPFQGHNRASVIGAILFSAAPPMIASGGVFPAALERVVATCLVKDRDERIQTAHDLRLQLEWIRDGASEARMPRARWRRLRTLPLLWTAFAFAAGIAAGMYLAPRLFPPEPKPLGLTASGFAPFVRDNFRVTEGPVYTAFDGNNVWVVNSGSATVAKIRASDGVMLGNFDVGANPQAVTFDGENIWVASHSDGNVTKLRAKDGALLGIFKAPGAVGLAFDGSSVWVSNMLNGTVSRLRASDGAFLGTVTVGPRPRGVAFDGANVWVANGGDGTVTKLRARDGAKIGRFAAGSSPEALAFEGTNVWVTSSSDRDVTKLRASDGVRLGTFHVGPNPEGIAFDGTHIWVASYGSNYVTELRAADGATIGTFPTGRHPWGVVFDGKSVWVANSGNNTISRISYTPLNAARPVAKL